MNTTDRIHFSRDCVVPSCCRVVVVNEAEEKTTTTRRHNEFHRHCVNFSLTSVNSVAKCLQKRGKSKHAAFALPYCFIVLLLTSRQKNNYCPLLAMWRNSFGSGK